MVSLARSLAAAALATLIPGCARAWGYEGHKVIAGIARSYLAPGVRAKVDALLATDADTLTAGDMASRSTWADAWRSAGHRETAKWHFVDLELDRPDLAQACFNFPRSGAAASVGPADDCIVDKVEAFGAELASPATPSAERLLALKYVLHFVGDLHQPLHAGDNHDRGGNCVVLALGGSRTVNLHSYWDTAVVAALDPDADRLAGTLRARITSDQKAVWERGDVRTWVAESYGVAEASAYRVGSPPGCSSDAAPLTPPQGYAEAAQAAAALQLERAGVRLALVLKRSLGGPDATAPGR